MPHCFFWLRMCWSFSHSFTEWSSFIFRISQFNVHVILLYKYQYLLFLCGREDGEFNKFIPTLGLPWWLSSKESTWNAGDTGSIPGSRRFPGGGSGNPLQYSCLKKSHRLRRLAGSSPCGCKDSDMTEATEHGSSARHSNFNPNLVMVVVLV